MRSLLDAWSRPHRRSPQRRLPRRLAFERLECRLACSGAGADSAGALLLTFDLNQQASAIGAIDSGSDVDVYAVDLAAGDQLTSALHPGAGGLTAALRVFDAGGLQQTLAYGDTSPARLSFEAARAGRYYLGVSASANITYDVTSAGSGQPGTSFGPYQLDLSRLTGRGAETEAGPGGNDTLTSAEPITGSTTLSGILGPGDDDRFRFALADTGNWSLRLQAAAAAQTRLVLYDDLGQFLVEADADVAGAATLVHHLSAGTYYVSISAAVDPGGDYLLSTRFAPTNPSLTTPRVGRAPVDVVSVDLNADGNADLVVADSRPDAVSVLLGHGDGSFAPEMRFAAGLPPSVLVSADFDGDQKPDIAVASSKSSAVSIFLGRGDGRLRLTQHLPAGLSIADLVAGDRDGDGLPDLAVVGRRHDQTGALALLRNRGGGMFELDTQLEADAFPFSLTAADFDGDGRLDYAVGGLGLTLALAQADGGFQLRPLPTVGLLAGALLADDLDGDGATDLIVANLGDLAVYRRPGSGTAPPPRRFSAGQAPHALALGDVDGDDRRDLLVANLTSQDVSLLRGNGDATFAPAQSIGVNGAPFGLALADFNRDGRLDFATANSDADSVSVLLGDGAGGFPRITPRVGGLPIALVAADFNRDGHADVVTANPGSADLALLLGQGDSTFQPARRFPAGTLQNFLLPGIPLATLGLQPMALATGDFNRDGRPDLAVAGAFAGDNAGHVAILLGLGDGSFRQTGLLRVANLPRALLVYDGNDDGLLDLAVAGVTGEVGVLLGNGAGSFAAPLRLAAGQSLFALAAGDFDRDGRTDLAAADNVANQVVLLRGEGGGALAVAGRLAVGTAPFALTAADLDADGRVDLAVANKTSNDVSILLGAGPGSFQAELRVAAGVAPEGVLAGDYTGDGALDLAVANVGSDDVVILAGRGDGTFTSLPPLRAGLGTQGLTQADFNEDGRVDLAAANNASSDISVLLALGNASFRVVPLDAGIEVRQVPYRIDSAEVSGLVVLDPAGRILFRRDDDAGSLAAARIVNADRPARDVVLIENAAGVPAIAALDKNRSTASIYTWSADGFQRSAEVEVGLLPVRAGSGDLNGDGLGDLVVASAFDNEVAIALALAPGEFAAPVFRQVDAGPAALTLADVDGQAGLDIVVAGRSAGSVTLLLNDAQHAFSSQRRFRSGSGSVALQAQQQTSDVAVADFTGDGRPDILAVNPASGSVTLLPALGADAFAPAETRALFPATTRGVQALTADFNRDGKADVALMLQDSAQVAVYLGTGAGALAAPLFSATGAAPRGLHYTGADLLVANESGDVLTLRGDGSGSFEIDRRGLSDIPLAVKDLNGDGAVDAVLADENLDRVRVLLRQPGTRTFVPGQTITDAGPTAALLAPAAVQLLPLDGAGTSALVVAAARANRVLVYRDQGGGSFGTPQAYDVGFEPVAVAAADLNSDGVLDLAVANKASSDVSILLGSRTSAGWVATPGPRLAAGGQGPIGVAAANLGAAAGQAVDGVPDLLVTSSDGSVSALPGIASNGAGTGFFRDAAPVRVVLEPPTPATPTPIVQVRSEPAGAAPAPGALTQSLLVAGSRGIARFDPLRAAFVPVFTTPVPVVTFGVSIDGARLVAGLAGGALALLQRTPAGDFLFAGEYTGLQGLDQLPSAVELIGLSSDTQEIYITVEGEELPLVLTFGDFVGIVVDLPLPGQTAEPTPPPDEFAGPLQPPVALLVPQSLVDAALPPAAAPREGDIGEGATPEPIATLALALTGMSLTASVATPGAEDSSALPAADVDAAAEDSTVQDAEALVPTHQTDAAAGMDEVAGPVDVSSAWELPPTSNLAERLPLLTSADLFELLSVGDATTVPQPAPETDADPLLARGAPPPARIPRSRSEAHATLQIGLAGRIASVSPRGAGILACVLSALGTWVLVVTDGARAHYAARRTGAASALLLRRAAGSRRSSRATGSCRSGRPSGPSGR